MDDFQDLWLQANPAGSSSSANKDPGSIEVDLDEDRSNTSHESDEV